MKTERIDAVILEAIKKAKREIDEEWKKEEEATPILAEASRSKKLVLHALEDLLIGNHLPEDLPHVVLMLKVKLAQAILFEDFEDVGSLLEKSSEAPPVEKNMGEHIYAGTHPLDHPDWFTITPLQPSGVRDLFRFATDGWEEDAFKISLPSVRSFLEGQAKRVEGVLFTEGKFQLIGTSNKICIALGLRRMHKEMLGRADALRDLLNRLGVEDI